MPPTWLSSVRVTPPDSLPAAVCCAGCLASSSAQALPALTHVLGVLCQQAVALRSPAQLSPFDAVEAVELGTCS